MTENRTPQVQRDHYFGQDYFDPRRFSSYGYQLRLIAGTRPSRVLEIGIGNGVVSHQLRQAGYDLTTVDLAEDLDPDVVASVTDLPFEDDTFDTVACFEVLEHMPWEELPAALGEIARVSTGHVIISLPDSDWLVAFRLRLPFLNERRFLFSLKRRRHREMTYPEDHYWEIGREHVTRERVEEQFRRAGLGIQETFRIRFCTWQRFYRLELEGA
jgi:SAM-dependent methyltransferase